MALLTEPTKTMSLSGRGTLDEFLGATGYFLRNFPRRTIAVFVAALSLAGLAIVSISMLLPLMTLGVNSPVDAPLVGYVRTALEYVGISYEFEAIFLIFVGAFALKVIFEFVFGLFIDNSSVLITRNFRRRIIAGLKTVSWEYLTQRPPGLVVNMMTQEIDRATGIFNQLQQ